MSCAAATPAPQPASRNVDPYRDVVIIPQDECPKFGGWIAKTQDAQALEDLDIINQERDLKLKVVDAQAAQALAEKQRDRANEALDRAAWLARWGLPIGAVSAAVLTALLSIGLYSVIHNGGQGGSGR